MTRKQQYNTFNVRQVITSGQTLCAVWRLFESRGCMQKKRSYAKVSA